MRGWLEKFFRFLKGVPKLALLKGFGVLSLGALLGFLFSLPLSPLAQLWLSSLVGRFPYRIQYASLTPAFPLGVEVKGLELKGPTAITLDTVRILPALLVEGIRPGFRFQVRRKDGVLKGTLAPGEKTKLRFSVSHFPLKESGLGTLPRGVVLDGSLRGYGDLLRTPGYPPNLSGELSLEIERAVLDLGHAYPIGITEISCPEGVKGDFTFSSNLLKIEPIELNCEKLQATIRGEVLLRQTLPLSQLRLRFFLKPEGEFLQLFQALAPLLRLTQDPTGRYQGDFEGPLMHLTGGR